MAVFICFFSASDFRIASSNLSDTVSANSSLLILVSDVTGTAALNSTESSFSPGSLTIALTSLSFGSIAICGTSLGLVSIWTEISLGIFSGDVSKKSATVSAIKSANVSSSSLCSALSSIAN